MVHILEILMNYFLEIVSFDFANQQLLINTIFVFNCLYFKKNFLNFRFFLTIKASKKPYSKVWFDAFSTFLIG